MANITYIKLGPIGDAFASTELGLYLNPNNASEIDKSILNNRLYEFSLTGFIVEISKLEYDNIKLLNQTTTNIPLNSVPVGQPNILEPVEDVVNQAPSASTGKRYLVIDPLPGTFISKKDYIAVSDGIDWNYIKPENGMILPVYAWGISVHYTGTYPSGSWDIPADRLAELNGGAEVSDDVAGLIQQFTDLLNQEIAARKSADTYLQSEIDGIGTASPFSGKASDVLVEDSAGLITANNVEAALKELILKINTNAQSITSINNVLTTILTTGMAFEFLYGSGAPAGGLGNLNYTYIDVDSKLLYKKIGTTNADAVWNVIFDFGDAIVPKVIFAPAGTPLTDLVYDWTDIQYSKFGSQPTIIIREKISDFVFKPRNDIYYELSYDDALQTNLLTLTIIPDSDGTNTIDNLQITLKS